MVGNGDKLLCNSSCTNFPIQLGNTQFLIDFYVLPINGADLVLGIQWLKMLGPTVTNYNSLSMQVHWNDSPISLQGITNNKASEISQTQLKRLHETKAVSSYFHLAMSHIPFSDSTNLSNIQMNWSLFCTNLRNYFRIYKSFHPTIPTHTTSD